MTLNASYAGDVSPRDAWAALELDPHAVLIDVRTKAEWSYVGTPDLSALDRPVIKIEWQSWPDGHIKLAWTRQLLKLRTELAEVFSDGDYQPLQVSGPHRDHIIAFAGKL